ncbi:MAG: polyprenyl synthetase family protein [Verrucomicrobiota bacterium]
MYDFDTYMDDMKKLVDSRLEQALPRISARPPVLHEAMRYSVFSGGKRLRPILCIACCEAVGGDIDLAMTPAAALEILHAYTLVHDDLPCMDNDDMRRGQPSCHIKYDETTAVLAGDGLHALAFELLGACEAPPPYPPNQLVRELAQAVSSRGLIGGQMADLLLHEEPTLADVQYVHATKTAALFRAAARIGAIAGECGFDQLTALTEYGLHLGLAFQIADDLLDKDIDNSTADGVNYLQVASADEAQEKAKELIDKAVASLAQVQSEKTEPLQQLAELVRKRAETR